MLDEVHEDSAGVAVKDFVEVPPTLLPYALRFAHSGAVDVASLDVLGAKGSREIAERVKNTLTTASNSFEENA
jgi:hypothetical protein